MTFLVASLGGPGLEAAEVPPGSKLEAAYVLTEGAGHRLELRERAAVAFTTLEAFASGIERSLPAGATAARLVRTIRAETVDYVFGVTENGRLLVGTQHRWLDPGTYRYVFVRGEMWRAFSRLDRPGPWTWLVPITVAPAAEVTLQVSAASDAWPVESLRIVPLAGRPDGR